MKGSFGGAAAGGRQRGRAGRGRRAGALEVVIEPGVLARPERRLVDRLVLTAGVAVVHEEERDRVAGVLGPGAVVEADRLVGREEVVVPAALDQQRRRRLAVVDVVGGVVGGELVDDRVGEGVRVIGLAGVDQSVPGGQIGLGIGPGRGVVAGGQTGSVEAADERLLLDPDRGFAVGTAVGRVGDVIEGAAVRHQRVGEVAPRPLRHRGGKFHRRSARALPGHQRAVREHRPVAQRGQRHRDPAAVGDAGGADPAGLGDPFVGEQGDQVLGVANFVAIVHQVVVAVGTGWVDRQFFRVVGAAGFAPATVAHAEDRIAVFRPPLGLFVEADLFAAPTVEVADQRVGPVSSRRGRGRQDHVDVDLGPVPGFGGAAAEADVAVGRLGRAGKIGSRRGSKSRRAPATPGPSPPAAGLRPIPGPVSFCPPAFPASLRRRRRAVTPKPALGIRTPCASRGRRLWSTRLEASNRSPRRSLRLPDGRRHCECRHRVQRHDSRTGRETCSERGRRGSRRP